MCTASCDFQMPPPSHLFCLLCYPSINEPDSPLCAEWLHHCSQQVPLVMFSEFLQLQHPGRAACVTVMLPRGALFIPL